MSEEKEITLGGLFKKFKKKVKKVFNKDRKNEITFRDVDRPSYLDVQKDFQNQNEYVFQLSKKLYEMYKRGLIVDSDDLFHFIEAYQDPKSAIYSDPYSKIFYYIWIGGDRCRKNELDQQCVKSIENFNKVFEKYKIFFEPFQGYITNKPRSTQLLDLFGNKKFVITLSQTLPSTFVVYYYDSEDGIYKRARIRPNKNVIDEIEKLRIKSGETITESLEKKRKYLNDLNEEFERYAISETGNSQKLYDWLGGNCEKNRDYEMMCRKNIDHFIKLLELYGDFFQPFMNKNDASREILNNSSEFYILLSYESGKFLVLRKIGNNIEEKIYTFEQLSTKKSTPVNIKKKSSYEIQQGTKLYESIPDKNLGEEEQYLKKIMKEIFHSDKLDDKKLVWILRWIGIDCPFDDDQECKNRFDTLIKLREEYEEIFNHLFDQNEDILYDFDPNYTYLLLSDTTPGKFKYIYFDPDTDEIKSIESYYNTVIGTITFDNRFIKYLDECKTDIVKGKVECVKGKEKKKRSPQKKIDTLYVFDFDLTLTYLFTCGHNKEYTRGIIDPNVSKSEEDNIFYDIMGETLDDAKKNIQAFKNFVETEMKKGNKIVIASFGTKEVIAKVMDKIFDGKSPFDPKKDIITEQDYGNGTGCKPIPKDQQRSKLNYIEEIIKRNNINPKKIYLIDDSKENLDIIKEDTKINGIPIQGIWIPTSNKGIPNAPDAGFITTLNRIKRNNSDIK
jgi:hypothetical protein